MMQAHADLWDINPQTGRLYSVRERRDALAQRGFDNRSLGGGQSTDRWDSWFDDVANANFEATGKTPAELNVGFAGGMPAEGSNQIRGISPGVLALSRFKKGKR